jgi:hypothetical protein
MSHIPISKLIAALVVVSATLVPTASAQPIDLVPPTARDTNAVVVPQTNAPQALPRLQSGSEAPAVRTVEVSSNAFDWGDAAVGAGGMLIVLSAAAAGLVTTRRSRGRGQTLVTG